MFSPPVMSTSYLLFVLLPFLPLAYSLATSHRTVNPDLNARLKTAATNLDRHALLSKDEDWTFDFNLDPSWDDPIGSVITANAGSFPALTAVDMTIAILNMGPCSMLPPHLHQRATNVVTGVKGNTSSWMINENGVRTVRVDLTPNVMTIFPPGSMHMMQNNNCEPSQLISALNSDDAGTLNVLNGLFTFPVDEIRAGFGDENLNVGDLGKGIPKVASGVNEGSPECMKRCGISHGKK